MADLSDLKKKIEEQKAPRGAAAQPKRSSGGEASLPTVDSIVANLKQRYAAEGRPEETGGQASGQLGWVRRNVAGEGSVELEGGLEWLQGSKQPLVAFFAHVYAWFKPVTGTIHLVLSHLPQAQELDFFLSSANLSFTSRQFLALTSSVSFFLSALALLASAAVAVTWPVDLPSRALPVIASTLFVFLVSAFSLLAYPRALAVKRAEQASAELPFALRQMSTQLRTGVGLYKSFQDIASADYGILSEEFSRAVNEIEEGKEMKDAIEGFARRTQSAALRRALLHINRALRTGGNLSETMGQIAEDVSFELRMRTRDFSEKMNFFGVIFIVAAIVLPVFLAIIGGITNAPIGIEAAALSPQMLGFAYLLGLPLLLAYLIAYLVYSQPKV